MCFSSHHSAWLVPWLNKVLIIRIILFAYQRNTDLCLFSKRRHFLRCPFHNTSLLFCIYRITFDHPSEKRKRTFVIFFVLPKANTLPKMIKTRGLSNTKPLFRANQLWNLIILFSGSGQIDPCHAQLSFLPHRPETLNKGTVRYLAASCFLDQSKKSFLIPLYCPRLAALSQIYAPLQVSAVFCPPSHDVMLLCMHTQSLCQEVLPCAW